MLSIDTEALRGVPEDVAEEMRRRQARDRNTLLAGGGTAVVVAFRVVLVAIL